MNAEFYISLNHNIYTEKKQHHIQNLLYIAMESFTVSDFFF